ncbi:Flp pilus assembly protein CpaB [Pseudodesulfovibrio cashew]|uniref:Flp pilus assembly protein CpaB n=1 Tax=Pseudodesulfovibrio cashew TaxID=2678688 RepID=A0A6I6JCN5_9BACT|nr:Flp pilus assembly protein CpaB [Pseudodesulfovibrio cashew]QGY38848.1 Flp pilus assembly protein CpaB [Pseudodesulfovibrio cashew]
MSKSTKALLQIGVALMLAMAAGVLIFMWTSKLTKQPKAVAEKAVTTVEVVVAKAEIKRGTKLVEDMLEVKRFTPDSRPSGAFPDVEALEGRVLSTDVAANEAVTESKLADPSVMGGGVSALIEPGKRAMSVKGNMVMGLAGFVRPGDRVDVIVTLPEGYDNKPVTKLVLERIKVLATGTELSPPDKDGKTASVDVYTLELSPEESERLALASTQGTLNFALRNEQDESKILTTGVNVKKALAALRPKPKPRKATNRNQVKVEVITGGDTRTLKF